MAKKTVTKKTRSSRSNYNDLPSMEDTEYSDFNSGSNRKTRLAGGRSQSVGSSLAGQHDYKAIARELLNNPTVKYVAGGIATSLLTKLATKLSDRYPEISNFIRENMDTIESKFSDYRNNDSESARH
jgi:hypothetical protein